MKKYLIKMTFKGKRVEKTTLEADNLRAAWKASAGAADALCRSGQTVYSLAVEKI